LIIISKKESKEKLSKDAKPASKTDAELVEESKDKLLRLQAEFANFRKRTLEEQSQAHARGVAEALKVFVDVFDDFQLALNNKTTDESFKRGMEMIFAKFISTAEKLGLQKINSLGQKFDPRLHEALLAEESDKESNTILEELQPGYLVADKVIRTAKVKVAK